MLLLLLLGGQHEGVILGGLVRLVGAVPWGALLQRWVEGEEGELLGHGCLMITRH